MNERIRQIAQQAGLQPFEDCGPGYVYKMEKFAELLVNECADIANRQFNSATGLDDRDCWTAAEIKRRFGVTK
jgi:hypothetical protein